MEEFAMAIPIILGGLAAAAGAMGIKKGFDASADNSEAERLYEKSQKIFDDAKYHLEQAKERTTQSLTELGKLKLSVWDSQFSRFVQVVDKVSNVNLTGQPAVDHKLTMEITKKDMLEMKDLSLKAGEILATGSSSLGAGALTGIAAFGGAKMLAAASTGTAIKTLTGVAASNATLAWFGGGSLAAGGLGVAGGTAVLGGLIAGPALAVGGMLMAAKARENLAEAKSNYAKARKAVEEMKSATSMLKSIEDVSDHFTQVIDKMDERMKIALDQLEAALAQAELEQSRSIVFKIKRFFFGLVGKDVSLNYYQLNDEQKRTLHMTYQFAQATKLLLETPLMNEEGQVEENATKALEPSYKLLQVTN